MIRANFSEQIRDRNSPLVADALSRACKICGSKAGQLCTGLPVNRANPPPGRIVHFWRTEE